ncbi:hypothetical protein [Pseudoxanthomonas beigongshangi]|uniref:hypothetical protein n=1 Tax=Pseudoxanthomonas beigongshangi TaxID=2782537 RepID=UPI00193BB852|nr:hypothetical protein [Pseudoxanthomonas beigongshangi]
MKLRVMLFSAAALVLVACGEKKSEQDKTAVPAVDAAATPAVTGPAAGVDYTLLGGYVPTFETRLRSKREEPLSEGRSRHIVIVEYKATDDAIGDLLSADLKARGLVVKEPVERNGAIRYVAQNSKIGRMTADINKDPALKLPPEAQGTIYFVWEDVAKEQ